MAQYKINTKCKVIEETAILMCVCVDVNKYIISNKRAIFKDTSNRTHKVSVIYHICYSLPLFWKPLRGKKKKKHK